MAVENYNENSDPSLGYYPKPGWEWQKPEPKTYLIKHDLAKYAQTWILNLVELVHWLPFIPTFILSFIIFQHLDFGQELKNWQQKLPSVIFPTEST